MAFVSCQRKAICFPWHMTQLECQQNCFFRRAMGLYSSPVISVHWGKCLQPEVPGVSQVIKFNASQSVSFSNKGSDGYIGQLYNVVKQETMTCACWEYSRCCFHSFLEDSLLFDPSLKHTPYYNANGSKKRGHTGKACKWGAHSDT